MLLSEAIFGKASHLVWRATGAVLFFLPSLCLVLFWYFKHKRHLAINGRYVFLGIFIQILWVLWLNYEIATGLGAGIGAML